MKKLLAISLLCIFAASAAAQETAPPAERWRPLLQQLGDADFAKREAAQKELDNAGPQDIAALRELAQTAADEEVKSRLTARIQAIDEALALNPPLLSLDVKDAPLSEVAAALSKQMGMPLNAWPDGRDGRNNAFTLSVKDKTFAEILLELSRQSPVSLQDFGRELRLIMQEPALRTAIIKGPVAIAPGSIQRSRSFDLQARPGQPLPPENYALGGRVIIDPRLKISQYARPQFTEVIDDAGNVLFRGRPDPQLQGGDAYRHWTTFSLTLPVPAKPGTKIVSARGVVRYVVPVAEDRLEIADAAAKSGQSFEFAGRTVKLTQFAVRDNSIQFDIRVTAQPDNLINRLVGSEQPAIGIAFVDADNRPIWNTTITTGGHSGGVGGSNVKSPVKILLTIPTKTKEVIIEFEMKDIPLP